MSNHRWIEEQPPKGVQRRIRCAHCGALLEAADPEPGRTVVTIYTREGAPATPDLEAAGEALLHQEE